MKNAISLDNLEEHHVNAKEALASAKTERTKQKLPSYKGLRDNACKTQLSGANAIVVTESATPRTHNHRL